MRICYSLGLCMAIASALGTSDLGDFAESRERLAADAASLAIVPVIHPGPGPGREVTVAIENASAATIRYQRGNRPRGVATFGLELHKEGRLVRPRGLGDEPPILTAEHVAELKPGESVFHSERLADRYGDLAPGRYEILAVYELAEGSVPHRQFGITPLKIRRRVAYLDVP